MSVPEVNVKVLNDGFVKLVDVMGTEASICNAARLTSGGGCSSDRDLMRYLMRHHHDTPFEFCGFTIHIRIPMDAWRQFVRHRLFSINEYSTRYSPAIDSMQVTDPAKWRQQAASNRQGSSGYITEWPEDSGNFTSDGSQSVGEYLTESEADAQRMARMTYNERLKLGVAREQARKDLPLSTYTEAWVECDLRGWLHFLGLRMDSHAQEEIREYANAIGEQIVAKLFPEVWQAFLDYRLNSVTLTALDIQLILSSVMPKGWDKPNCREYAECREKLRKLGLSAEHFRFRSQCASLSIKIEGG